jgi:hypothetical protein
MSSRLCICRIYGTVSFSKAGFPFICRSAPYLLFHWRGYCNYWIAPSRLNQPSDLFKPSEKKYLLPLASKQTDNSEQLVRVDGGISGAFSVPEEFEWIHLDSWACILSDIIRCGEQSNTVVKTSQQVWLFKWILLYITTANILVSANCLDGSYS